MSSEHLNLNQLVELDLFLQNKKKDIILSLHRKFYFEEFSKFYQTFYDTPYKTLVTLSRNSHICGLIFKNCQYCVHFKNCI